MRVFSFIIFLLIEMQSSFALDHFWGARAGFGISGFIGSDSPEDAKTGYAWSLSAIGAQAFYPNGPLWGTEISYSMLNMSVDTVLWNDNSGYFDDTSSYNQSFGRISLGLFLMKNWDFGMNFYAGPQVSYLLSCTKSFYDDGDIACSDDYKTFQLDAQMTFMLFIADPFAIDFKYVQTLMPFDKKGEKHILSAFGSIGVLYEF